MDDTQTKQQNNYHLWNNKADKTINKVKQYGVLKTLPNGRIIRTFYSGIPDTISKDGHDTGTFMITSQKETF